MYLRCKNINSSQCGVGLREINKYFNIFCRSLATLSCGFVLLSACANLRSILVAHSSQLQINVAQYGHV